MSSLAKMFGDPNLKEERKKTHSKRTRKTKKQTNKFDERKKQQS